MKTTVLISLLCLAAVSSNAQYEFQYSTKDHPPLKADAKPIPVRPAFDGPYTVVTDTPCTMYKRHDGLYIVNCPGIYFPPEKEPVGVAVNPKPASQQTDEETATGGIRVERENAYSGYLPDRQTFCRADLNYCRVDPQMPANAVPAWPKNTSYIMLQDPPCYEYINKHGLKIMECHGLRFPPEHDR